MREARKSVILIGLFIIGVAVPFTTAAAQDPRACRQIREACQGAGFIQGAAREGIGLQIHCVMPIMQARPQPVTARKPLPRVNPQLVADCRAINPRFGQPHMLGAFVQPLTANPPPGSVYLSNNPPPAYSNRGQTAVDPGPDNALRPATPMVQEERALVSALPPEDRPETGPVKPLPAQFRRTMIEYRTKEPAGTIIIDTPHTYLYLVLGNGKAMRYGIGVGREGFTWNGAEKVTKMAEWPDWHPPEEMIERQPYLPRFMAGGEGNPLGARALYLGQTLYRIHGTNQPSTIGTFVSSGCIRLTNEDIVDLYGRVKVGTRVVVLPGKQPDSIQATTNVRPIESAPSRQRPKPATAETPAAPPAPGVPLQALPLPASPTQAPTVEGEPPNKDTTGATPAPAAPAPPLADEQVE
jgi:lipoprotein-anchoring transpeptidase ErfK/SrfK